jgi:hypothetical protein
MSAERVEITPERCPTATRSAPAASSSERLPDAHGEWLTVVLVSPGSRGNADLYDPGTKREIAWRGPETSVVHRST